MGMRRLHALLALLAVAVVTTSIFWVSLSYFQSEERTKAQGRLSLFRSTVLSELERFSHLTYVLARDPFVIETAQGAGTDGLNRRFAAFARQSGLDAIYLMRRDGVTISASNSGQPGSFVGQDYSFRPYFLDATAGRQGRFYGIGATTGLPGYFIADAVRDGTGAVIGVVAIKLDLSKLEASWSAAGEQVFLANRAGVVLLSSTPAWRYRALRALSPEQEQAIRQSRQFPGQPLDPLDWTPLEGARAQIGGVPRIHLIADDLPHGWELHYFASDDRAVARSLLVTAVVPILAALVFIFSQLRRTNRIGAALQRSVAEEAQLRQANERLAVEIEERKLTERQLKRTQGELERASRLAALGQLAASVTHELGQPLAAIRNHLAAAEMNNGISQKVAPRISALVDRMEGITRQLKFFARTDNEGFREVDLRQAMQAALELVEPNIQQVEAEVTLEAPDDPVVVRGDQLRLEQVMTNLLRNAMDALDDSSERRLVVRIGMAARTGWFEVRDSGHGLGDAALSDLQEPFFTTRESGRGMGLGLAISGNIVKEHHGRITARNADTGGAVFRVEIPLARTEEEEAAE
ncbi:MAG TPA: ATP-binding protein [Roseovarius sp.]|nr:ATP-binding protein [Roseovarius sp.]